MLDSLRGGRFFTTTGEILIPSFTVGGKPSGEEVDPAWTGVVDAELEWTFPMAFAEIVSGDGKQVFRQRVELGETEEFRTTRLRTIIPTEGRKWVRFEAWDVAGNGAFTQPVWIGPKGDPNFPPEASGLPVPMEKLTAGFSDVIPTAATQPALWRWTVADPAKNWMQPTFKDDEWNEGKSAFGTATTPGTDGILNTTWNTKDIWLRRVVTLPQELGSKLRLRIHHDNKAEVYIDGIPAWSAVNIETRDYGIFEISPEAMTRLKPGAKIILAAHGHNGVGGQVLDVGLVNLK